MALPLFILASIAAASPQATEPKPIPKTTAPTRLQPFSFMGETSLGETTRTELNGNKCENEGPVKRCRDFNRPTVAGIQLQALSMEFFNKHLSTIMGFMDTDRYIFLLEVFTAKYGPPKLTSEEWQAKSGVTFDNSIATWQFDDGELELKQLGSNLNTGIFYFFSATNQPPREKPKIDF